MNRMLIANGAALLVVAALHAADLKVDLSKETVGKPPATFEPMVGTWIVAQDGADKVIMIDGRPWVASKDNPTKLLIESARKLYGTRNEELMDNAKQFGLWADLGSIEVGKRANLLLLRADPLKSITAFDTIETVFLDGNSTPRRSLLPVN